MTGKAEEVKGVPPEKVLAILREKASEFEITAGEDENAQVIRCRLDEAGEASLVYTYTQLFPGRMLREVRVRIALGPKGGGTAVTLGGELLRAEVPPGKPVEGSLDVKHEVTTVWTYLKNLVMQEVNARRVETAERTYNAGSRELFLMLKDPSLLVPASCVTVEKDESKGRVVFQDATGSLVYLMERLELQEPGKLTYHVESNTSNMWIRSGRVELVIEKINEARSRVSARAVAGPTQISEQMQMSAMYLPAEQLSAYLSFRQDLSNLMGWMDAAVPLQIPHIRDMVIVQGDFVAGGKVEIKDSVLNRTDIRTGGAGDGGRYLVHADRQVDGKVQIGDSVVSRSGIEGTDVQVHDSILQRTEAGGRGRNIEVYQKSLEAAFRDGRIDDSEAAMIDALQKSLGVTPQDHLWVLEELGVLGKDDIKRYARILGTSLADGKIDASEEAMLEALREQYGIPLIVHQALVTKLARRM